MSRMASSFYKYYVLEPRQGCDKGVGMAARQHVKPTLSKHLSAKPSRSCGGNDRRAYANLHDLRRTDIHEEASVKTGARRSRDFPDIHSASSAIAERHESSCAAVVGPDARELGAGRTWGSGLRYQWLVAVRGRFYPGAYVPE